ncbi:MAG TPA: alginate lyase family protein [Gemmatimonadaceae bacterium]
MLTSIRRVLKMERGERAFRLRCASQNARDHLRYAIARPTWNRGSLAARLDASVSTTIRRAIADIDRGDCDAAHTALARHFVEREWRWPLSPRRRVAVADAVRRAFPYAAQDARARAGRLDEGTIDLLGYRNIPCGRTPDWHRDAVHDRRAPDVFWMRVPYLDPACGDHKIIWELNRHQHWLTLGRSRWLSSNGPDPDAFEYRLFRDQFVSWMSANAPLSGINWASMLEPAFRTLSWVWALAFFAEDAVEDPTPWTLDMLLAIDRQLAHVERNLSRYFSPNTHLTGEALALYAVSMALPELRASAGRARTGRDVLLQEIDRQINADGGHAELSPHYHRYSTDFYLLALLVARRAGDPAARAFEDALRRQAHYLRTIAADDGRLPLIGDDDGGQMFPIGGRSPADARPTLAAAAEVLGDASLALGPAPEETYWLLGGAPSYAAPATASPWASRLLPDSGYVVLRSTRGDHLMFDAGPHGFLNGGHAHADGLSVDLTVAGRPLFVDPGTATYTMDLAVRDRFRSTAMHNTVSVDGLPHAEPRGPFHWREAPAAHVTAFTTAPPAEFAEGTREDRTGVRHTRSVLALPDTGWLIVDRLAGPPRGTAAADAWWHFHPDWTPSLDDHGVEVEHRDGTRVSLAFDGASLRVVSPDDPSGLGAYAPEYGRIEPAFAICAQARKALPFAIGVFVSAPSRGRVPCTLQLVRVAADEVHLTLTLPERVLAVTIGGGHYQFTNSPIHQFTNSPIPHVWHRRIC